MNFIVEAKLKKDRRYDVKSGWNDGERCDAMDNSRQHPRVAWDDVMVNEGVCKKARRYPCRIGSRTIVWSRVEDTTAGE